MSFVPTACFYFLLCFFYCSNITTTLAQKALKEENAALKEELAALRLENQQLKLELKKCGLLFWDQQIDRTGTPDFPKTPTISAAAKETLLAKKLEQKPDSIQQLAQQIEQVSDDFIKYCDQLTDSLVLATGGYDENNRPIGKRNKEDVQRFLLTEGRATQLKKKLIQLRTQLLSLKPSTVTADDIHTLAIDPAQKHGSRNLSWEEFNFGAMPMAAVYVMLRKMKGDAVKDKVLLLEHLSF